MSNFIDQKHRTICNTSLLANSSDTMPSANVNFHFALGTSFFSNIISLGILVHAPGKITCSNKQP